MLTLNRAGLAAGTFLVVIHLVWAGLVSFGVAQSWFDLWLNTHFIQIIYYTMKPFGRFSAWTINFDKLHYWLSFRIWAYCFCENV